MFKSIREDIRSIGSKIAVNELSIGDVVEVKSVEDAGFYGKMFLIPGEKYVIKHLHESNVAGLVFLEGIPWEYSFSARAFGKVSNLT